MRKIFEDKIMQVHEIQGDARSAMRNVGKAAESQATLNIALTGVCVAALLVAVFLVRSQRTGAPYGR
jgi:CHASE3 domain sensor protein